jgi:hypothetical protein
MGGSLKETESLLISTGVVWAIEGFWLIVESMDFPRVWFGRSRGSG